MCQGGMGKFRVILYLDESVKRYLEHALTGTREIKRRTTWLAHRGIVLKVDKNCYPSIITNDTIPIMVITIRGLIMLFAESITMPIEVQINVLHATSSMNVYGDSQGRKVRVSRRRTALMFHQETKAYFDERAVDLTWFVSGYISPYAWQNQTLLLRTCACFTLKQRKEEDRRYVCRFQTSEHSNCRRTTATTPGQHN